MAVGLRALIGDDAMRATALFVDRVRALYDVREVIAFGSRVRGNNHPDSDFDLAVVLNGPSDGDARDFLGIKLDMADEAFDVLLETGILIQPLPLWKKDFVHPVNPRLMRNIMDEGIRVS